MVKEEVKDIIIALVVNTITVGAGMLIGYMAYPVLTAIMK
jgi:hypothetical protein